METHGDNLKSEVVNIPENIEMKHPLVMNDGNAEKSICKSYRGERKGIEDKWRYQGEETPTAQPVEAINESHYSKNEFWNQILCI